jgi:hypothetical protein
MAGTIAADTLTHSTAGSLDTSYVVNGSAKAWVDIDSVGTSILDSLNISSLDDDGVGDRGLNYVNAFSTANSSISLGNDDNTSDANILSDVTFGTRTTGGFDVECYYTTTGGRVLYDTRNHASVHGDLA